MPARRSGLARTKPGYQNNVFINCPFDAAYKSIFHAIVFAVYDAGFYPRCALELGDASEFRLQGIMRIIRECRYGIHDISRTQRDRKSGLPRFNMPLELGIFLGCKNFGAGRQRYKSCLVIDTKRYRYQQFISDIAGQDVNAHGDSAKQAVTVVRDWLRKQSHRTNIPGGQQIWDRFLEFQRKLPALCRKYKWSPQILRLLFDDYRHIIYLWLKDNAP